MKTFIAIPSLATVPTKFMMSLACMKRIGDVEVANVEGSLVYHARNKLANQAIQAEADRVLWLDSDMVFGPNLLERMDAAMREDNIDFLTALCFRRKPPYTPCIYDKLEKVNDRVSFTQFLSIPEGRFKVGGCGFAGVLIGTDVLMSVSAKFNGHMFDPIEGMGEDISFCWRARQCGYDIWCDSSITMGHVGEVIVNRGYYEAFNGGIEDVKQSKTGEEDQHDSL